MAPGCVVHCKYLKLESPNITLLKESTCSQSLEVSRQRTELDGAYLHQEQCDSIPKDLDVTKHRFHRQCWQKLTNAVSVAKRKGT